MSLRLIKATSLSLRLLSFVLAVTVTALCITLIKSPPPSSTSSTFLPPQLLALLAFSVITVLQAIFATLLILLSHERAWLTIGDIISICGYATSTLLLRGVIRKYQCRSWMTSASSPDAQKRLMETTAGTVMRFLLARSPSLSSSSSSSSSVFVARRALQEEEEPSQCVLLQALFGGAIAGCAVSLLAAGMVVWGLKKREEERRRMVIAAREEVKRASLQRAVYGLQRSGSRDSEKGLRR